MVNGGQSDNKEFKEIISFDDGDDDLVDMHNHK
jgi:hypothetical protein